MGLHELNMTLRRWIARVFNRCPHCGGPVYSASDSFLRLILAMRPNVKILKVFHCPECNVMLAYEE